MKYIILLVTICIIIIFKNLVNILKYLRLYIYAKKQVLKLYKNRMIIQHNYLNNNFYKIFPKEKIRNINYKDFKNDYKVNIDKNLKNQYKIANLKNILPLMNKLYKEQNLLDYKLLNNIFKEILKHVHLNGKKINIEDCVILDMIMSEGGYFPGFHTDVYWNTFDDNHAFQIWYLLDNNEDKGNMFILPVNFVEQGTFLIIEKDKILVNAHGDVNLKKINYNEHIKSNIKYLDMKGGECLIFTKELYHMSDFRYVKNRININVRFALKDKNGMININTNKKSEYLKLVKNILLPCQNLKIKDNKIKLNRYELI